MRLKEIKPGMAIRCHNFEQGEAVVKQLNSQGAGLGHYNPHFTDEHCVVYFNFDNQYSFWKGYDATCDFSDLIFPELTAEEVWNGIGDVEDDEIYEYFQQPCAFETRDNLILSADWKDLVAIVEKHIADHEKKEPEIETEWFWQGRIFKIREDGCYYQIKDGTGFYDTGCEYRESAEEYMKDELKEYCKTHKGEFIAVVEHVCRVKAVE